MNNFDTSKLTDKINMLSKINVEKDKNLLLYFFISLYALCRFYVSLYTRTLKSSHVESQFNHMIVSVFLY